MLYGATSESVLASGNGYSSGPTLTLGGTDATFVVTFQLPAMPPTGSLSVLQVSMGLPRNSSNPATYSFYSLSINTMSVASFGPSVAPTSGYSNFSGYLYGGVTAAVVDAVAGTTTSVSANQTGTLPQFVPKLFGGSWVTVAVSVSSTGNVVVYTRDSVLSSNSTFGASSAQQ